jgi:hypothetical protein
VEKRKFSMKIAGRSETTAVSAASKSFIGMWLPHDDTRSSRAQSTLTVTLK